MEKTLQKSAENAIKNCLELETTDRLVIVTDEETLKIAEALRAEAQKITQDILFLKIEDYGTRPMTSFPEKMKADIDNFKPNVSIYAASGKTGELQVFRSKLIDHLAYDLKCHHAHMISITEEIMLDGMSTDYNTLYEMTEKIYNLAKNSKEIKVTSDKGTDLIATFSPNLKWVSSHGKIKRGLWWQNLPGTETFTCPETVNGRVAAEILGDYFSTKYGHLPTPLYIDIKDSFVWNVTCENKELEEEFKKYIFTSPLGNKVGEFAFGTNIGLTHFIGNLLQDEKYPGIHLAFGHPYCMKTGATWDSPTHVDVIPTEVNIWIDAKQIMEKGKYII